MSDALVAVAGTAVDAASAAAELVAARAVLPPQDVIDRFDAIKAGGVVLLPELNSFQIAYFFDKDVALSEKRKSAANDSDAAVDASVKKELDAWFRYKCVVQKVATFHYFQLRNYGSGYVELMRKQNQTYPTAESKLRSDAAKKAADAFAGLQSFERHSNDYTAEKTEFLACLQTFCGGDNTLYAHGVACFAPENVKERNVGVWTPNFEQQHRWHNVLKMSEETGMASNTYTPATRQRLQTGISVCGDGEWLIDAVRDIVAFCRNEGEDGPSYMRMCRWQLLDSRVQLDANQQIWGFCPDEEAEAFETAYARAQADRTAPPASPGVTNPRPWRTMDARFSFATPGFEALMLKWQAYLRGKSAKATAKWSEKERFERFLKTAVSGKPLRDYQRDAQKKKAGKLTRGAPAPVAAAASADAPRKKSRVSMQITQGAATAALIGAGSTGAATGAAAALVVPSVAAVQQVVADRAASFTALSSLHRQLEEMCSKLSAYTSVHTLKVELYRCIILSPATVVSGDGDGFVKYGSEVTKIAPRWRDERDTVSFADANFQKALTPWHRAGAEQSCLVRGDPDGGRRELATTRSVFNCTLLPYAAVFDASRGGLLTVNYELLYTYYYDAYTEACNVLSEFHDGLNGAHYRRSPRLSDRWNAVAGALERRDEGREPEAGDAFHLEDPLFAGQAEALCEVPETLDSAPPCTVLAQTRIRPFRFFDHVRKHVVVTEIAMLPVEAREKARKRQLVWETLVTPPCESPKWIIFFDGAFMHRVESAGGIAYVPMVYKEPPPPSCALDFLEERTYTHSAELAPLVPADQSAAAVAEHHAPA